MNGWQARWVLPLWLTNMAAPCWMHTCGMWKPDFFMRFSMCSGMAGASWAAAGLRTKPDIGSPKRVRSAWTPGQSVPTHTHSFPSSTLPWP